jgi:hypothetical protein
MGISALMADGPRRSFALEDGKRIERFDDSTSFRLINRERYHPLSDGILGRFDAVRQELRVCFEHGGFIESHPRVTCAHWRSLSGAGQAISDN